jgi:hypothetical protein
MVRRGRAVASQQVAKPWGRAQPRDQSFFFHNFALVFIALLFSDFLGPATIYRNLESC